MRHLRVAVLVLLTAAAALAQTPSATSKAWAAMVTIRGTQNGQPVTGSGFLVAANGTIVTNLHLVSGLSNPSVEVSNGDVFDTMTLLSSDARRDIAVVRIAGFDLPYITLGNSNQLQVGDAVMLVASAKEPIATGSVRAVLQSDGSRLIQTSAPAEATGAGGLLMNANGEAVGVLGIRSPGEAAVAVPINYARGLLEQNANLKAAAVVATAPAAKPAPTPAAVTPPTMLATHAEPAAPPKETPAIAPAPPVTPVPQRTEPVQVAEAAPPPVVSARPKKELKVERMPEFSRSAMKVRKIFIASLGEGDGPDMLRDKIARTLEQNHFVIVDKAEAADAVLSGAGQWSNLRVRKFRARLAAGEQVIWSGEVSSGGWVRSASSSVADKLVDQLMSALAYPGQEQ